MKPKCIVVSGRPCSGKTNLAGELGLLMGSAADGVSPISHGFWESGLLGMTLPVGQQACAEVESLDY